MLELARMLGLDVDQVTAALAAVGEHVESVRKKMIEEPVVRRVHEYLGREYEPEEPKAVPVWQRHDQGGPARRAGRPRKAVPGYPGPRKFDGRDASMGLGNRASDAADAWALEEWKLYDFSEAERDGWRDAGLRDGQARLAREYRDAGLVASDLSQKVDGWDVAKHLRAGESPKDVLRRLRRRSGKQTG